MILGFALIFVVFAGVMVAGEFFFGEKFARLERLEERLVEIDQRLDGISEFTMRTGVGSVGYKSNLYEDSDTPLSLKVNWGDVTTIEQVVIVPVLHRDNRGEYRAHGLPAKFSMVCGTDSGDPEIILANQVLDESESDRIAPLIFNFTENVQASWLRLDIELLRKLRGGSRYELKIAEIKVFSGEENVALGAEVIVDDESGSSFAWRKECLVDGHMPYVMDTRRGESGVEVFSRQGSGNPATIIIDLGKPYPINRIHLHTLQVNDTVPLNYEPHFGVPRSMIVTGALNEDFRPRERLFVSHVVNSFRAGPIMGYSFEPTMCRYLKFVADRPYYTPFSKPTATRFGYGEIEVFSNGENVAKGKAVSTNFKYAFNVRDPAPLTDGRNVNGDVIPMRQWVNELAERYELEKERPEIVLALNSGYQEQRQWAGLLWLIVVFLIVFVVIALVSIELFRRRSVIDTRKRISADLHDEFGANLHAIGLLSDLADSLSGKPEQQSEILSQLKKTTRRAGESSRYLTNMLEADELYEDVVGDMNHVVKRLFADWNADISFSGSSSINSLSSRKRIDLFLFFQESVTNAFRHSGADTLRVEVFMDRRVVEMTITDNGVGMAKGGEILIPKSLRRRARYLRAKLEITQPEGGGTRIRLKLRLGNNDIRKINYESDQSNTR